MTTVDVDADANDLQPEPVTEYLLTGSFSLPDSRRRGFSHSPPYSFITNSVSSYI